MMTLVLAADFGATAIEWLRMFEREVDVSLERVRVTERQGCIDSIVAEVQTIAQSAAPGPCAL